MGRGHGNADFREDFIGFQLCVKSVNIALTNVAPTAIRARQAEELLSGKEVDGGLIEEAAQLVMGACDPVEDQRGDIEYKTNMARVMAQRAITSALEMAGA